MRDQNWLRALRATHELELRRAPKRHRLQTSGCPPLARLATSSQGNWTPEEKAHIEGCRYCQKIRVLVEGESAQSSVQDQFLELVRRLAAGAPPRAAREGTGSELVMRLVRAPLVHRLSQALAKGQQTEADVQRWWRWSAMSPPISLPAAAGRAAATKAPPFRVRAVADAEPLVATLRETDDGQLILHVRVDDPTLEGTSIAVNVMGAPDKKPLAGTITLQRTADGDLMGQVELGSLSQIAEQLGPSCWLLVAPLPPSEDAAAGSSQ
jgi:hypothetical protein